MDFLLPIAELRVQHQHVFCLPASKNSSVRIGLFFYVYSKIVVKLNDCGKYKDENYRNRWQWWF
jgi:hypothetical protein